jgi:hypothetical protein
LVVRVTTVRNAFMLATAWTGPLEGITRRGTVQSVDQRIRPSAGHSRCVVRGFEALSEATPPVGATPRTHRAGLNGGDDGWQDQRLTPERDLVEVEGIA